jgi:hypothetical protein
MLTSYLYAPLYISKLNKRISEVQKHVDGKEEGRKIVGEEGRTYVLTGKS